MSFKLYAILRSMKKSYSVLVCPVWDVSHPFVQAVQVVYNTYLLATQWPSWISDQLLGIVVCAPN
jgi:hypothetical protein